MRKNWRTRRLTLESATTAELGDLLAVLDEAAAWLRAAGIDQWPDRFKPEWVEPAVERGETWLARLDGVVAGTITLDWDDELWTDHEGTAGYVHRMAVSRTAPGLGATLLDWAAATARALGCTYLRLDCVTTNTRLRTYYESHDFHHQADTTVAGPPGQRTTDTPTTQVSLYQLTL
ncbi:GNAT family N-acetyltransferase [Kribbella sp. CA-247076]|uniref:GNAT family N-acetyltransferase n=1 Tax=Kribbella sp. CA-247076 TaxID=3239941 RepID=UPI003D8DF873